MLALCDFATQARPKPKRCGIVVTSLHDAGGAAAELTRIGTRAAVFTLGEKGALYHANGQSAHVAAFIAGK